MNPCLWPIEAQASDHIWNASSVSATGSVEGEIIYTFRKAGAILFVSVPATIITSDCLGDARNRIPIRSWSYLAAAMCIISTAQQANPNVMGHIEFAFAQFMILSRVVTAYSINERIG